MKMKRRENAKSSAKIPKASSSFEYSATPITVEQISLKITDETRAACREELLTDPDRNLEHVLCRDVTFEAWNSAIEKLDEKSHLQPFLRFDSRTGEVFLIELDEESKEHASIAARMTVPFHLLASQMMQIFPAADPCLGVMGSPSLVLPNGTKRQPDGAIVWDRTRPLPEVVIEVGFSQPWDRIGRGLVQDAETWLRAGVRIVILVQFRRWKRLIAGQAQPFYRLRAAWALGPLPANGALAFQQDIEAGSGLQWNLPNPNPMAGPGTHVLNIPLDEVVNMDPHAVNAPWFGGLGVRTHANATPLLEIDLWPVLRTLVS